MSEEAKEIIRVLANHPDLTEQILTLVLEQVTACGIPLEAYRQVLQP